MRIFRLFRLLNPDFDQYIYSAAVDRLARWLKKVFVIAEAIRSWEEIGDL